MSFFFSFLKTSTKTDVVLAEQCKIYHPIPVGVNHHRKFLEIGSAPSVEPNVFSRISSWYIIREPVDQSITDIPLLCAGGAPPEHLMSRGTIHIGTSGWHYAHWVGPFYPRTMSTDEFLAYYVRHFATVEINNTFYHLPAVKTLKDWARETPKSFLFACKGSRFITHMKKLKDPKASIQRFFEAIEVLRPKLGPIVFQLPPRWGRNADRLKAFLEALPDTYRYAFEFRDTSWFDEEIYRVLRSHNAAFCMYHLAGLWSPEIVTADFIYARLHGPKGPYEGSYSASLLRRWAAKCKQWSKEGKEVYCYFDNDDRGFAPINALALLKITKSLSGKTG